MTPDQIILVQQSFQQVEAIRETAAKLFYARLWEIDPSTAPLFEKSDMGLQGHKLMAALALVVSGLSNPESVIPVAQDMARRHVAYGVTRRQYASVGAALLWTLGQGLGAGFTPDVEAAWTAAYELLAAIMTEAAYAE
ncbi:globin family protein [Sediminicoccus sp. KRV36]|uniref:globin family protein n=1 Tax=Sediminicoccus sp. KRV36 TaxID=3133721 RepID=UPI00200CDCEB|nr:globin family protein [Sediminicoccus rosea]UPY36764.1 globin domain-containing protein [Sediminicoccus rosea]